MQSRLSARRPSLARIASRWLALSVLCVAAAPGAAARAARAVGPVDALLPEPTAVERALADGELQLADSLCRGALLEGWLVLGAARRAGGDPRSAARAFGEAAVVAAADGDARLRLGRTLLELGEREQAAATLRALSERHPRDPGIGRLLEIALQEGEPGALPPDDDPLDIWLGSLEPAERLSVIERTTEHLARGYLQLGLLAARQRPDRAPALFARAESLSPGIRHSATTGDSPAHVPSAARPAESALTDAVTTESAIRVELAQREDAELWDRLGIVLSRDGRLGDAEQAFRRALELHPEALEPRQHLARLQLLRGEATAAARELRLAAATGDLDRDLALQLASLETWAGHRENAERQLVQLVERYGSVRALLALADLAVDSGESDRGLDLLAEALRLAPSSEDVLAAYAALALSEHQPAGALLALEPLVRMHPEVAEYSLLEGRAHLEQGELATAGTLFERSVELDPDGAEAWAGLAATRSRQGRFAEAEHLLRSAPEALADDPGILAALAEAAAGQGRSVEAEELAERALRHDPASAAARRVLGRLRIEQRRWAEAADLFLELLAMEPDDQEAHRLLSLAYDGLNKSVPAAEGRGLERPARVQREAPSPTTPSGG